MTVLFDGLALVLCLATLFCVVLLALGWRAAAPMGTTIGPAPPVLQGAEPVAFRSVGGAILRGWWVPGDGTDRKAVVLMHGVRANRLILVRRAAMLRDHGFSVLLFDLRAHGASSGRRITFGALEAVDAAAAVGLVRDRVPGARIGVIGISLGGAAALLGPAPLAVDALVLESVFPGIEAAFANRLRDVLGPVGALMIVPLAVPAFRLLLPLVLGVRPGALQPLARIGGVTAPVLIQSGDADRATTVAETAAMFSAAPVPKQLRWVAGAAHVDLERHDPEGYRAAVLPFLEWHLSPGGGSFDVPDTVTG